LIYFIAITKLIKKGKGHCWADWKDLALFFKVRYLFLQCNLGQFEKCSCPKYCINNYFN